VGVSPSSLSRNTLRGRVRFEFLCDFLEEVCWYPSSLSHNTLLGRVRFWFLDILERCAGRASSILCSPFPPEIRLGGGSLAG